MITQYKYSEPEIKQLLKSIVVICDTRKQQNDHITGFFEQKNIPYINLALSFGDYSYMLPSSPELGIYRDMYFTNDIVIERKANLEELSGNFAQQRDRFENEFLRAGDCGVTLMVENGSLGDIIAHKYRTKLSEKSFWGTLLAWENRYNFKVTFIPVAYSGQFIYSKFYYHLREMLKN